MGILNTLFGKHKDLVNAIEKGGSIVDVRTEKEFSEDKVNGSINIPLNIIESRLNDLKKLKEPIILCCASGIRSGQACRFLKSKGINCVNGGSWMSVNSKIQK